MLYANKDIQKMVVCCRDEKEVYPEPMVSTIQLVIVQLAPDLSVYLMLTSLIQLLDMGWMSHRLCWRIKELRPDID